MVEEDAGAMQAELKEAFRLYDKEGICLFIKLFKISKHNNKHCNKSHLTL